MATFLNENNRVAHKRRNLFHSVMLVGSLALLMGISAWLLWGSTGVIGAIVAVASALAFGPKVSPELVMKLYRAQPIPRAEGGSLHEIMQALSRRAELPKIPRLYLVPSPTLNAFAVGSPNKSSVAITHGMLRSLGLRELTGVLAHEISHIQNNDLWILGLADTFNRLTQIMSYAAIFLFMINLPLAIFGGPSIPWLAVALLYFAPTIGSLLQLGLSRAREYEADLQAAALTGDPQALASALAKLERDQGRFWEDMVFAGRRMPQPSLLRSHPPTEERIRRLMELAPPARERITLPERKDVAIVSGRPPHIRPRYHWPGVWY